MILEVKDTKIKECKPVFLFETNEPAKIGFKAQETFKKFFGATLDKVIIDSFYFNILISLWVLHVGTPKETFNLRYFVTPIIQDPSKLMSGGFDFIAENLELKTMGEVKDILTGLQTSFNYKEFSILFFNNKRVTTVQEYEKIIKEWRGLTEC